MKEYRFALDASALMAVIIEEKGRRRVAECLDHACISSVNYSEVVSILALRGMATGSVLRELDDIGLSVVAFDRHYAVAAGLLRPLTDGCGMSFGDRACIALAHDLKVTALTADRAWARLPDGIADVELIR